jgi:hypothetical protein
MDVSSRHIISYIGLTSHEVGEVTESLPEDHVPMLASALFQFLLQIPASVLVLAQRGNLAGQVLHAHAGEAVVCDHTQ